MLTKREAVEKSIKIWEYLTAHADEGFDGKEKYLKSVGDDEGRPWWSCEGVLHASTGGVSGQSLTGMSVALGIRSHVA